MRGGGAKPARVGPGIEVEGPGFAQKGERKYVKDQDGGPSSRTSENLKHCGPGGHRIQGHQPLPFRPGAKPSALCTRVRL